MRQRTEMTNWLIGFGIKNLNLHSNKKKKKERNYVYQFEWDEWIAGNNKNKKIEKKIFFMNIEIKRLNGCQRNNFFNGFQNYFNMTNLRNDLPTKSSKSVSSDIYECNVS